MTGTSEVKALVAQSASVDLAKVTEVSGQGALVPVQTANNLVPIRPKHLDGIREQQIQTTALEYVNRVKGDPSNWELGNFILRLGQEVMEQSSVQVSLYDAKMGEVLKVVAAGDSPVSLDILSIKTHLDFVNPTVIGRIPIEFKEKVFAFITKTVMRVPKGDEVIRMVAERRETVQSTVDGIRRHLMGERDKVLMQASELGVICDQLKALQPVLQEQIYLGQLIWQALMGYVETVEDAMTKETVMNLINDLAMTVVDLQTIDNMHLQTRFGGEMIIRNSRNVQRLVQRTDTILRGAVANALAVRVAAAQQLETMSHLRAVQDSIAETMVDTAKQVGQAAVTGARMSQEMVVNIDKLQEACDAYEEAANAYAEISKETIEIAKQSSNALGIMNDRFRSRTDAMTAARK